MGLVDSGSTAGGCADRSSKLMMYRQMSSTSLRTGAITSEQRNLVPGSGHTRGGEGGGQSESPSKPNPFGAGKQLLLGWL